MGLHSSVVSLSRFFHCSWWVTLKSPQSVSSHQYCVKKDRHIPVLWQAVLCKSSKIVLAGFTAISHCKLISSFLLAVFPQEGFFFFMFCFILLLCKYFLVIQYLCSGLFFPRWTRLQFSRLNPISFPAIFLTSSGSLVLHCPHWSFKRLLVCLLQI